MPDDQTTTPKPTAAMTELADAEGPYNEEDGTTTTPKPKPSMSGLADVDDEQS